MLTNISYDLETWGTQPGCEIRSIGAIAFGNGHPPVTFYRNIKDEPGKYGLNREPGTVKFWNDHPEAAKAFAIDPVSLPRAVLDFAEWLDGMQDVRLWSHGAHFDEPILRTAYLQLGLDVPWHYRAVRDTRTAYELAGMDPTACLGDFTTGTHHNALDDACTQAKALQQALDIIRRVPAVHVKRIVTDKVYEFDIVTDVKRTSPGALTVTVDNCGKHIDGVQITATGDGNKLTFGPEAPSQAPGAPIPMILHCPRCFMQHIDKPSETWDNPPHRKHLCQHCGQLWKPANIATEGVEKL